MASKTSFKQRIVLIISVVSFLGAGVASAVRLYNSAVTELGPSSAQAQAADPQAELKQREKGYEIVLAREPNNQIALEGLATARLDMNNVKGAIDPLEKLVKLDPTRPDYAARLAEAKQKAGVP